jgi:hypothetical protein
MASVEAAALFGGVIGSVAGQVVTPALNLFARKSKSSDESEEPTRRPTLWIVRVLLGVLLVGAVIAGFLLYEHRTRMLIVGCTISVVGAVLSTIYTDGFSEGLNTAKQTVWEKGPFTAIAIAKNSTSHFAKTESFAVQRFRKMYQKDSSSESKKLSSFWRSIFFFVVLGGVMAIAIEVTKAYALDPTEEELVESFIVMIVMAVANPLIVIVQSQIASLIGLVAFLVTGPFILLGNLVCPSTGDFDSATQQAKEQFDEKRPTGDDVINAGQDKVLDTEAEMRPAEGTTVTVKAEPRRLRKFMMGMVVADVILLLLLLLCETNSSWGTAPSHIVSAPYAGESTHFGLWGHRCSDAAGETTCADAAKWPIGGSVMGLNMNANWNWDSSPDDDYTYSAILETARVSYGIFWLFTLTALACSMVGTALPTPMVLAVLQDLHIALTVSGSIALAFGGGYFRFRLCGESSLDSEELTLSCFYNPTDDVQQFLNSSTASDHSCDDKSLGRSFVEFAVAVGLALLLSIFGGAKCDPKGCVTQVIKRWKWKVYIFKKLMGGLLRLASIFLLFVSAVQLGASSMGLTPMVCLRETCRRELDDLGDSSFTNYFHELENGVRDVGSILSMHEFKCSTDTSGFDRCGNVWYQGFNSVPGCLETAAASIFLSAMTETNAPSMSPTNAVPAPTDAPTAVPTATPTDVPAPKAAKAKLKIPSGAGAAVVAAVVIATVIEVVEDDEEDDEVTVQLVSQEGEVVDVGLPRTSSFRVLKTTAHKHAATRLFKLTGTDADEDGEEDLEEIDNDEYLHGHIDLGSTAALRLRLGSVVSTRYRVLGNLRDNDSFEDRLRKATSRWLKTQREDVDIEEEHIVANAESWTKTDDAAKMVTLDVNVRPEQLARVRDYYFLDDYAQELARTLHIECSRGSVQDGNEFEFTCQLKQVVIKKKEAKKEAEYVDMRYYEDDPDDPSEVPSRPIRHEPPSPHSAAAAAHRRPFDGSSTGVFAHGTVAREDLNAAGVDSGVVVGGGGGVAASPGRSPRRRGGGGGGDGGGAAAAAATPPTSPGPIQRFLMASEATPVGGNHLEAALGLSPSYVPADAPASDRNVMHWEM